MTNLVSENGHVLPPDCIEIYSGYTDHWQSFASRSDHLVLLASGQTSNEISVRLSPSVWGRRESTGDIWKVPMEVPQYS